MCVCVYIAPSGKNSKQKNVDSSELEFSVLKKVWRTAETLQLNTRFTLGVGFAIREKQTRPK